MGAEGALDAAVPATEDGICSIHGKKRTAKNLVQDGRGGVKCTPQDPCRSGALPGQVIDGDWICEQCGDHQFARNKECRKCGAPKPVGGRRSQFAPKGGGRQPFAPMGMSMPFQAMPLLRSMPYMC